MSVGLPALGAETELDFLLPVAEVAFILGVPLEVFVTVFPTPAVVVVAGLFVVVVEDAIVGFGSSGSGLTTTNEVTGVTKLYLSERFVAFSVSKRCTSGSVLLSLASRSSLIVK